MSFCSRRPGGPRSTASQPRGEVRLRPLDTANGEVRHSAPQFCPDGRHFVYFAQSERPEIAGIYVASLDSTATKLLLNSNTNATYAGVDRRAGYLLFTRGTDLVAQGFNLAKLALTGAPFPMAHRVLIAVAGGVSHAAVSHPKTASFSIERASIPAPASWNGSTGKANESDGSVSRPIILIRRFLQMKKS